MIDDYNQFIGKKVIIVLSNQMRFTGVISSVGDEYIKIVDKFDKIVYIVRSNICSVEEEK